MYEYKGKNYLCYFNESKWGLFIVDYYHYICTMELIGIVIVAIINLFIGYVAGGMLYNGINKIINKNKKDDER